MQMVRRLKDIPHMKYGRIIIDFAIITLLAVVIFRRLLFTSEWPAGGDVLGWISRAYLFGKDFRWLYVWRPHSFGFVEGINLLDLFLMLIYLVCWDPSATIKIFMLLLFLAAGFSMYAFAYRYTHRHMAALSASLIYTLNQWFLTQFTEAHIDITFGYALAPLLFLLTDKALETRKSRYILTLALMLSIFLTGSHPQCIGLYGLFLMLFVVFYFLLSRKPDNFRIKIKHFLTIFFLACTISFFLSAFSLIPFLLGARVYYYTPAFTYPIEWTNLLIYENITDAFTLRGVENWGYIKIVDIPTGLALPDFPISSFLLFLFSLAYCTIFLRKDRYTAFFAVTTVILIFISKGPRPPFGYIFEWAWFNVPHFAAFRSASRCSMMVAFSHAFFISVLVSILTNYVQKNRHLRISETLLSVKLKTSEHTKELYISLDLLGKIVRGIRKLLYYFSIALLISIFLSGFFSCFFFFSQGLQDYAPPQNCIDAYEWIAKQPGDCRIVTVGRSSAEWLGEPTAMHDFAGSSMLTSVGWGHDIGFDSSFIHDKSVLQDGGWEPLSRAFVDHLRFRLASREYLTDDLLKMLGTFDYKFIVLPSYASAGMKSFFLNQQGAHIIYNQSGSLIIENCYHTPRIFVAPEYAVVIGGLESFSSLCKIDSLDLNQTALIFTHQIDKPSLSTGFLPNSSKALIFVNSDLLDMVMLSLRDDVSFINAATYGVTSLNHTKYWIRSPTWRHIGGLVLNGDTLMTSGGNSISIPFRLDSDGTYDIWIRIGFTPWRGKLSISIDGDLGGEIYPYSGFWSALRWVNITRLDLRSGDHVITLTNDGTGLNDVDAIAIVKPSIFQLRMYSVLSALRSFPGRIVYVLGAENAFTYDLPPGWSVALKPYDGFMLHTEAINVSPKGKCVSASSVAEDVKAQYAIDENRGTRWSTSWPEADMPQWLQVEWETAQELVGVRIMFERACAKDYIVQTWDDTTRAWVDQVNVTGNNLFDEWLVHKFQRPVKTTKLRIYVTSSSEEYKHVSIWEFEAHTAAPPISTKVSIPREGHYMFAIRLASGPDYGDMTLRINNNTATISCSDSDLRFHWYEVGPLFLNVGEQTITIHGVGKIDFDQMIIYSLKDEEGTVSLNQLFEFNSTSPSISYEKVNPCKYNIHVNSSEPFLLIFSDSYHPLWKVYVDNAEISPIIAYSLVNGFFINKTGEFNLTLYFTGKTYADIGLKISMITVIATIAYLTIPSSVIRSLRHKFGRKK